MRLILMNYELVQYELLIQRLCFRGIIRQYDKRCSTNKHFNFDRKILKIHVNQSKNQTLRELRIPVKSRELSFLIEKLK